MRQPSVNTKVNYGHPLCAGLKAVFSVHRGYPFEELTQTKGTLVNGATVVMTDRGFATQCGLNNDDKIDFGFNSKWIISTAATHVAVAKNRKSVISGTGPEDPAGAFGGGDDHFKIELSNAETFSYQAGDLGASNAINSIVDADAIKDFAEWHVLGGTWDGATCTARMDNFANPSPTSISGTQASNQQDFVIGNTGSEVEDSSWDGWVQLVVIWDRGLSEAEWNSFVENPWQIFEPRIIWMPTGVIAAAPAPPGDERIMGAIAGLGGLAGEGGLAGKGGGLAG